LTQSDPTPVDLSVADIRWQIAAEWSEISQSSQWTAYRKPPHCRISNGHIAATGDPLFPQKEIKNYMYKLRENMGKGATNYVTSSEEVLPDDEGLACKRGATASCGC